ncbi:MAG: PAS domain S-box protein [Deltaproteobacteria bacterium]|nr:PAS domain S-box protein [Deltaproteobacteria bacterium]
MEQLTRELEQQRRFTAGLLWHTEETFSRAFQENPDAIALFKSSDSTFLDLNKGFTRLLQFTADEAVGKSPDQLHNWVDAKERKSFLRRIRKTGQCTGMEARFRAKDGSIVHGFISAWPVQIQGESCLMTIIRDLTDRKQAEDLLRIQRDLGSSLMDAGSLKDAADAILKAAFKVPGVDCGGVFVVDDFTRELSLKTHRGIPRWFAKRIASFAPDSPQVRFIVSGKPVYGGWARVGNEDCPDPGLATEAALPVEYEGRVVACLYVGSHNKDDLPERARYTLEAIAARLGSAVARLKSEESLRESEARFAAFMDMVPGNVFMKDENGLFLYANRYMKETFGRKRWVGRPAHKIFGVKEAKNWTAGDAEAMEKGVVEQVETLQDKNRQQRVYRTFKFPIPREGRPPMLGGIGVEITAQVEAERAQRNTLQQVMAIFNTFPGGIKVVDTEFNVVDISERLVWMYGLPGRKWAIGKKCYEVMKGREDPCPYCSVPPAIAADRLVTRFMAPNEETGGQTFKVYTHPIKDENGRIWGALECVMDVSDLKEAEDKLRRTLKEKELLLREVHHRVKNNMQVICTLLSLQAARLADEDAKAAFMSTESRIRSMALAHEMLYRDEDISRVDLGLYVQRLAMSLFDAHGARERGISFNLDADGITLALDQAVPCGMVVNEIITNSLKHAFPGGRTGTIRLSARSIGQDVVEVITADDGVGLPENVRPGRARSLGMDLIYGLVESQLSGTVIVHSSGRSPGTSYTLRFGAAG